MLIDPSPHARRQRDLLRRQALVILTLAIRETPDGPGFYDGVCAAVKARCQGDEDMELICLVLLADVGIQLQREVHA